MESEWALEIETLNTKNETVLLTAGFAGRVHARAKGSTVMRRGIRIMNEATARSAALIGLILLVSSLVSPMTLLDNIQERAESSEHGCVVCINEVMADADGSDKGIFPQGEWVELWNSGDSAVNLQGWTIVDIGGWTHPIDENSWVEFDQLITPYSIEPGNYAVIAENDIGTLRLNNAGETIYLKDSTNTTVDTVITGQSNNGISKIADPNNSNSEWIDAESPSPGQVNVNGGGGSGSGGGGSDWVDSGSSPWDGEYDIKFTRIMPGEVPDRDNDWLEITNFGDEEANITGWSIERIRSTTPWVSKFGLFTIPAGESVVLSENPANLLADGGISSLDGNSVLDNMPWLVDSGAAFQLKEPAGTVVDALVYNGGDAEIEGWTGSAISVPGDGSPGLILMRGDGCSPGGDSDSATEWEIRWIRIGASTFCDGGLIEAHSGMSATASFSPETGLEDLLGWIADADTSLHVHMYEFLHPDLTHALIAALDRDVSVTILLEEGILDDSSTKNDQRGHAQSISDAGGTVYWMVDPTVISSPYQFIHSKVAVKDSQSVWISSGNWKESSLPTVDESGNREWSLFIDSTEVAIKALERMVFDENSNHLHIDSHSSYYAPSDDWELPQPSNTLPNESPNPDTTTPFRTRILTCPDDCVTGIVSEINEADSNIRLSLQYLDLDWYWGFGAENPILESLHQAASRGVRIELMINAFYADWDDDVRDAVNLFNTDWNATQGLDVNARLMSTAPDIWKLHNKGMIVDDDTVLVGSMNWGSNSMLRNREMGIISESSELTAVFLSKFNDDWNRLDDDTDSDGDLLPDSWEELHGLDRHNAAVLGTALSEQSLDGDDDGLNNLNEYLLNGNPNDNDTDDDCILDGDEEAFAQSVMRSPGISMVSADVDQNGIPDGEQFGCENNTETNDSGSENENNTNETDNQGGIEIPIINVREDPLSTPGAKFLLGLTVIAGISVIGAGVSIIRRPKTKAEEKLIDDSGYSFDEADVQKAILSGTRFDESSEDTRQWTEGKDDGKHGSIVLDGFGFEELSRDEVQWRLDQGISIEELRDEFGEDEV